MAGRKWLKPINTSRNNDGVTKLEEEEPLSPVARLFHEPQFNCSVIAVVGFKSKIDEQVIKEGLKNTLINHPRFSSTLVHDPKQGGKPTGWIRTKLIIDDHVIVPNLDLNMESPDQYLEDYISNMTKTPMDVNKPLWELHLLNIKANEATSIGVFKIHHSVGDGMSLMSLILACTRQTSNPDALPTFPTGNKKKKQNTHPSSLFGFLSHFIGLFFLFKLLWNTMIDLAKFMATALWLKDTNTPVKGACGTERTANKRFVYKTVSLDDVKLVKEALDVTINDVLLGITQAGLSYYLNRKYGEMKGERKAQEDNLPKRIRLRSSLLVNLRPTSTTKDYAEKMESNSEGRWKWGNMIGYVILPFQIALRDNPLDYILNAKAEMDKKKQSLEAQCTYVTVKIMLKTLGLRVVTALTYRVLSHATLSFSNIVGPKEEISFYGHPIAFIAPSVYGHPQALTVHFQSYMNKMTLVLAVDQNVIPDPKLLCDDIEESLRLVKNAVAEKKLSNQV